MDNFVLRLPMADYFNKKKSYIGVGLINRTICALLERYGLEKYKVKAVSSSNATFIPAEMSMLNEAFFLKTLT